MLEESNDENLEESAVENKDKLPTPHEIAPIWMIMLLVKIMRKSAFCGSL